MNAIINRSGCISCGLCTQICPEVFNLADDGLAEVCGEITDENMNTAKEAAEGCPVAVIAIEEE